MGVRASEQGIRKAREALTRKGWTETKLLEIAKLRKQKLGTQQRTNFFNGKAVARSTADKIGFLLDLTWEKGDLEPELGKKKQDKGSDIDELVQEVRSRCCDKIQHLYSKIQLLNRQQIDVDKLYVDVYVLEELSSESHATIPDLLKGSDLRDGFERLGLGRRQKRSPGFEVAAHHPRLMVLGKPGSGKTTFLRHLAVACCKSEFLADHIPILIELRFIKDTSQFNLLNTIHREFRLADRGQTEEILNQGKVLILLDGLDEVPGQSKRDVQDHIYEFSQQYYKNRFILTCRTQTTEYSLATFEYVEVADFNPEQVKIFAQNWFTALAETPEQGTELTVKFLDKLKLPDNKQTAELAVTPILLSLTCWVFNDLKGLPPKRSDLYEQGINLLLEKWDEKRGVRRELGSEAYRKLSVGEKKKLLSYVAARKFEQEQYVLFEQGELQEYIAEYLRISTEDSEAVLDAVAAQHGLLIERAQGFWSFSHLTFQEYFAAKWFCDRADWDSLVSHINERHWREVFLLAVGMAKNADELLCLMKDNIDAIVAEEQILQEFMQWANQKSIQLEVSYKPAAIRAFYFTLDLLPTQLSRYIERNLAPAIDQKVDFAFHVALTPDLALDRDLIYLLELALEGNSAGIARVQMNILESTYPFAQEKTLAQNIQQLREELSSARQADLDKCWRWWEANGQDWTTRLRKVMIDHRQIGQDWQFGARRLLLLSQYYDANKLLVDCLNSGCVVKDEVRKEIEERLLLPIAEIEKLQQQM
jgi:predicted NACHT family NTPase